VRSSDFAVVFNRPASPDFDPELLSRVCGMEAGMVKVPDASLATVPEIVRRLLLDMFVAWRFRNVETGCSGMVICSYGQPVIVWEESKTWYMALRKGGSLIMGKIYCASDESDPELMLRMRWLGNSKVRCIPCPFGRRSTQTGVLLHQEVVGDRASSSWHIVWPRPKSATVENPSGQPWASLQLNQGSGSHNLTYA
jgi:hypothetical protein